MIINTQKEQIYKDFYGKIYGYIKSKIISVQEAEDLTADVFVKVYAKIDSFDETKSSLSTWIYTITRNTLTDYYRTKKVFGEMPEDIESESTIEDDICNEEMLEALAQAIEKLDERARDIIILHFYHGKSLKTIAQSLDISYSYVKILQKKALENIKAEIHSATI